VATEYRPQLATLVKEPPAGAGWLHEIKFDGYRIGCRIRGSRVSLISRNGKDWTHAFPEVVEAAARLGLRDALLDGEVAMVLPDGRTSFQSLQNASTGEGGRGSLVYFVFDLLKLDGERVEDLPLEERKARVRALVGSRKTGRIRYSAHVDGRGDEFFAQACRIGLEGIISKRRDLPHREGRHGGWVKTKCTLRQEFVIGGFTDPEGARAGLGALLIGYYAGDRLIFSGKVGTGFTHKLALDVRRRLDAIEQKASPFTPPPAGPLGRNAHWVKPALVCEVEFTEWTGDGKIRHPSFQGLRADKKPRDVTREIPRDAPRKPDAPVARSGRPKPGAGAAARTTAGKPEVAGIAISHSDRMVYPDPPLTKLDVARYYEAIREWVVPHVQGRPLTLVRCPEGISSECFFMKHSKVWAPAALRRVQIQEKKKVGDYLVADDIAGVVGLVQMGVLEIHTWNSLVDDVERPNRIVFDLDPGEKVTWARVIRAALQVRAALEALDLECYVKTTGGRGLHVVVPLVPQADWAECLEFSRALSERLQRADPRAYTTEFAKAGREDKILIDYLRNNRTNTSIAAYSTRARPGAPISVPLTWDELRTSLKPAELTVTTLPARLGRLSADPWKGYWAARQRLTQRRQRAVAHP
jgi:bifunctional non-homologous end joining protein LigD